MSRKLERISRGAIPFTRSVSRGELGRRCQDGGLSSSRNSRGSGSHKTSEMSCGGNWHLQTAWRPVLCRRTLHAVIGMIYVAALTTSLSISMGNTGEGCRWHGKSSIARLRSERGPIYSVRSILLFATRGPPYTLFSVGGGATKRTTCWSRSGWNGLAIQTTAPS